MGHGGKAGQLWQYGLAREKVERYDHRGVMVNKLESLKDSYMTLYGVMDHLPVPVQYAMI